MSTTPPSEPKPTGYEFNDEQNRTIGELASAMGAVASLLKIAGLAFLVFFGLLLYQATQKKEGYGAVVGVGAATLLFLSLGLWTSGATHSFRRIVESQNRDLWHLMNALGSLRGMYSLLRTMIVGTLVLLAVGFALVLFDRFSTP